jgi:hypothetical protein
LIHDATRQADGTNAVTATFRFHAELNAFLPAARRQRAFSCACAQDAALKHVIETLGVPHTEVALLLVNGRIAHLTRRLGNGDRVDVHPASTATGIAALADLPAGGAAPPCFIADAHLGGLARLLRLAGFDTRYENALDDAGIVAIALREGRCVLSRDVGLLKRRDVQAGCYVHALKPVEQFGEIVRRLGLARQARPFSRCLACNAPLRSVAKEAVLERLPPRVREQHERFTTCDICGRLYWEGSHWKRMRQLLQAVPDAHAV